MIGTTRTDETDEISVSHPVRVPFPSRRTTGWGATRPSTLASGRSRASRALYAATSPLIALLVALVVWTLPAPAAAQTSHSVPTDDVRDTIDRLHSSLNLPGIAVAVFDEDEILFRHTSGSVPESSRFYLGSLTKALTAMLVLRLVERTKLELETRAHEHLPWDFPRQTRVADLLHHRSGIKRGRGYVSWHGGPDDLKRHIESIDLGPGPHTFTYSNLNYEILGKIVETVTERPYAEALRTNVLDPLEMDETHVVSSPEDVPELAPGHQYLFGFPIQRPEHPYYEWEIPSRFVASTVSDMVRFGQLHLGEGKIDSARLLEAAHVRGTRGGTGDRETGHVMGWFAEEHAGLRMLRHEGLTTSYHSSMALLPEEDVGVVALSNVNSYGAGAAGMLTKNVALMTAGKPTESLTNFEFVLRLVLGIAVLGALGLLGFRVRNWARWEFRIGLLPGALWRIGPALAVALGLVAGIPAYYGVPLFALLALQPDFWIGLVAIPVVGFFSILIGEWNRFARVDADPDTPSE